MGLILASKSPRRRELLDLLEIDYITYPSAINEGISEENPERLVMKLASMKADFVAEKNLKDFVLAADTIVCLGKKVLGKPKDAADAKAMLTLLSGKTHQVYTGVALKSVFYNYNKVIAELTEVDFREIRPKELAEYIKSNEPFDKAGGYGIQGFAGVFVTAIRGSYHNVVGLPLAQTAKMLGEANLYKLW
ncbi:MAG: Maf family protein [Bacillota bacterium]|nr:Maf family protein [Bacillota bacterium]